jgi:hypothetical protein
MNNLKGFGGDIIQRFALRLNKIQVNVRICCMNDMISSSQL